MSVTVRIAHCEIYNEQFYDLLAPYSRADIQVMEDAKGAVFVKGLTYHVAARCGAAPVSSRHRAVVTHEPRSPLTANKRPMSLVDGSDERRR
jgi:hypothetical protein